MGATPKGAATELSGDTEAESDVYECLYYWQYYFLA